MKEKIKVKKIIHAGWMGFEKLPKDAKIPLMFGKYQYIYKSNKEEISLIKLVNYLGDGKDLWEIYCWESGLFEGTERFDTKKEADIQIREYLN